MFSMIDIIRSVAFVTLQVGGASSLMHDTKTSKSNSSGAGIEIGNWAGFVSSAPDYRICTVQNGIFSFQIFADGQKRFGINTPTGMTTPPSSLTSKNQESILLVEVISGKSETFRVRTRRVTGHKDNIVSSSDDIVINDPRLTVEVRLIKGINWVDPIILFDFLKRENSVKVTYGPLSGGMQKTVDTSRFSEIIDWCSVELSR